MSKHFCKVGKVTPNLNKTYKLDKLKEKAVQSFEVVHNKKHTKGFHAAS